jgi:hypothetical protein
MNSKGGLIGAVILVILLSGVVIWQYGQLSGEEEVASAEKTRNAELQKKVESDEGQITQLQAENQKLKETADYYYQQGVDLQSSGNMTDAKAAFEAVVAKFPTSNLVGHAQQRLATVNEAIAKTEADRAAQEKEAEATRLAEQRRQQEEQEKLTRERDEEIDYSVFYAKVKSKTLPTGKRFRFVAVINHDLNLSQQDVRGGKALFYEAAAFDDQGQYEQFLQGDDFREDSNGLKVAGTIHTIVASMGFNGWIQIHRIE